MIISVLFSLNNENESTLYGEDLNTISVRLSYAMQYSFSCVNKIVYVTFQPAFIPGNGKDCPTISYVYEKF